MSRSPVPEVNAMWEAFMRLQKQVHQDTTRSKEEAQVDIRTVWTALNEWQVGQERKAVREQAWKDAEEDRENGYKVVERALERAREQVGDANEDWQDYYARCYLEHHHHVSAWGYKGDLPEPPEEAK